MSLKLNNKELLDLMKNFYTLTGIRFVLFDENYKEILSYPEKGTPFCSKMRQNAEFDRRCCECDKTSFERCRESKSLTVYRCHAGLMEATAPLTDGQLAIGYIMLGQIADKQEREKLVSLLYDYCLPFSKPEEIRSLIPQIKYKEQKQIAAASKILDACTSYILRKEMVKPSQKKLFSKLDKYISEHLSEKMTVETLCREFGISRTRLYEAVKPYVSGGIAVWIREKQMERARELLIGTEKKISEISFEVGFSDYGYFLRTFRKTFGVSPKQFRSENA